MTNEKTWRPDDDKELEALIRATIASMGVVDPASLPSRVRDQIKSRVSGDADIDSCIKRILAETRKKD